MNVLIIHAHTEPKSFTTAMKDVAVQHFQSRGDNIIISDLYEMNFNPVGLQNDFKTPANPDYFSYLKEQIIAFQTNNFSDDLKAEMDKLVWADFILFNFPLWWSSSPAILKGWFDRVLALGFAYHPRDKKYETGPFFGKKAMCAITTGGSRDEYSKGGKNGDIMDMIYHINHGTLYYCGINPYPSFFAWRAHLEKEEVLKQYLVDYKKHLENLDNMQPLY